MKIPRDVSSKQLIKALKKLGYEITRQKGSHIRLTLNLQENIHHITIPDHNPIKIGTLNNILNELSIIHKKNKQELVELLINK